MKRVKWLLTLLTLVLFVACGGGGAKTETKAEAEKKVVRINLGQEPGTMDPQLTTDQSAMQILPFIMEGLTRLGATGDVVPGVAESWSVDGNKWTFKLRDTKWSNGKLVTAHDFVFGIRRAIEPETASEYAYMTYYIKNAQAYNEGKIKDFSKVGVKALDDKTVVFELEKPAAYFASVTAFPTYYPLNEEFFKEKGEEYALEKDNFLFNGPFKMTEWEHDSKIVLEKRADYWNASAIKLDGITALMVNDSNTALNMYKNGELDIVGLGGDQLPEFKDSPELVTYSDGSVWYFEFNTKHPLLSNRKIREAITIAIDRKELVEKIKKDGSKAGQGMVPYGFPGIDKGFREDFGSELYKDNDVERAKKLLAEGLKEVGHTGPVELSLLTGTSDTATKEAQFYQEQLRTKLGIETKIEQVTFQIRLQRMSSRDFEIVLAGWGPDYNDPMTYMDLWVTNGGNNHTGWSNAEYDALINKAQTSSDNKVRMEAMAAAEKILAKEFPIGVTFYRNRNRLVKPYLKNVYFRAVGQETDLYYADIQK
ncbi:MAG: extracellular solute-binding protein family 5 [Fusobacteriales bacterium]|nr:extracellular solute-binding protein family 5 [Fusobacteriales bacterium]